MEGESPQVEELGRLPHRLSSGKYCRAQRSEMIQDGKSLHETYFQMDFGFRDHRCDPSLRFGAIGGYPGCSSRLAGDLGAGALDR